VTKNSLIPSPVSSATYVVTGAVTNGMLRASPRHTVTVRPDGVVWTWGTNDVGQLGDGTTVPTRPSPTVVSGITGIQAIAAGDGHTLALTTDGHVWSWGRNGSGQLGDTTTQGHRLPAAASISGVVALAAGDQHSVALKTDGTVWTWGDNGSGQLGDGTTTA